jgi:hypothetical protein
MGANLTIEMPPQRTKRCWRAVRSWLCNALLELSTQLAKRMRLDAMATGITADREMVTASAILTAGTPPGAEAG